MENSIRQLAKFFCVDQKPAELLVLPCSGIIHDSYRNRYGFLFRPPAYIEDMRSSSGHEEGAVSILRKPVSLLQTLDQTAQFSRNPLELGVRFQLARKLVQSIYILHAAGWVHKKLVLYLLPQLS